MEKNTHINFYLSVIAMESFRYKKLVNADKQFTVADNIFDF